MAAWPTITNATAGRANYRAAAPLQVKQGLAGNTRPRKTWHRHGGQRSKRTKRLQILQDNRGTNMLSSIPQAPYACRAPGAGSGSSPGALAGTIWPHTLRQPASAVDHTCRRQRMQAEVWIRTPGAAQADRLLQLCGRSTEHAAAATALPMPGQRMYCSCSQAWQVLGCRQQPAPQPSLITTLHSCKRLKSRPHAAMQTDRLLRCNTWPHKQACVMLLLGLCMPILIQAELVATASTARPGDQYRQLVK